jgi:hypothetical protein
VSFTLQVRLTQKHLAVNAYWRTATIGEVQVLQQEYSRAGELYEAAVTTAPEEIGSHESTCKQASLILDHLNASITERQIVLKAFRHLEILKKLFDSVPSRGLEAGGSG